MSENTTPETDPNEPPKAIMDHAPKAFIRIEQSAGARDFFLMEEADAVQRATEAADPEEFVPFISVEVFSVEPEKRFEGLKLVETAVAHRAKFIVAIGEVDPLAWKSILQRSVPPPQPPATPTPPPGMMLPSDLLPPA